MANKTVERLIVAVDKGEQSLAEARQLLDIAKRAGVKTGAQEQRALELEDKVAKLKAAILESGG